MLDSRQQELYSAWCAQCAQTGDVPPRSAFDPLDFPRCLPALVLYEFTEDDAVRLRLVGTEIAQVWGSDYTGRCLHEFMNGDYHDFIRGHIDQVREERVPIFSHSRFQWDRGRVLDTRRLLLPYARNDAPAKVGFVLLCQVFDFDKVGPSLPKVRIGDEFDFFELDRKVLPLDSSDSP